MTSREPVFFFEREWKLETAGKEPLTIKLQAKNRFVSPPSGGTVGTIAVECVISGLRHPHLSSLEKKIGGVAYIGRDIKNPALFAAVDHAAGRIDGLIETSIARHGLNEYADKFEMEKSGEYPGNFKNQSANRINACFFIAKPGLLEKRKYRRFFNDLENGIEALVPEIQRKIDGHRAAQLSDNPSPAEMATLRETITRAFANAMSEAEAMNEPHGGWVERGRKERGTGGEPSLQ